MPCVKFEYHPAAIKEAESAYRWYARQSPVAAERFWQALVDARQSITRLPEAWPPYFHGTRCLRLPEFPYGLVYIQLDDRIVALAVCHFRQRPGYWHERTQTQS